VLRSVGRTPRTSVVGDGYEELRQRGKKKELLERVRTRTRDGEEVEDEGPRPRKKTRFDREARAVKRRASSKRTSSR
jgi:U3 small nucleolar ribonucleoprotein protein LCP5